MAYHPQCIFIPFMKVRHVCGRLLQLHPSVCVFVCFQTVRNWTKWICCTSTSLSIWRLCHYTDWMPASSTSKRPIGIPSCGLGDCRNHWWCCISVVSCRETKGCFKKGGHICFLYHRKSVCGIRIMLSIHMLCFNEISLACVQILWVAYNCSKVIIKHSIHFFLHVHGFVVNVIVWRRFWALCEPGRRHLVKSSSICWHDVDGAFQDKSTEQ